MFSGLKQAWRKLPFWLFLRSYYIYCKFEFWPTHERRRISARLPLLSEIDLAPYKTSDTLFVLASGPSINAMAEDRWQAIRRANSVGFNFWLLHPFVPTFYFFECSSPWTPPEKTDVDPQEAFAQATRVFQDAIARRAHDYTNVIKVVMDLVQESGAPELERLPAEFRHNLFVATATPLVTRRDEEFGMALRYLVRKGAFHPRTRIHYLFKHTASLSAIVALGALLQYRRIVLCGVDLSSEDRFYHDQEEHAEASEKLYRDRRGSGKKHLLLTRYGWSATPIDVVLLEMRRQILEPAGIELYVENPKSELAGRIAVAPQSLFDEINARTQEVAPAISMTAASPSITRSPR